LTGYAKLTNEVYVFRLANLRFYLLARFLTTISSEMQSVAVGWQVYELTHRALDLGFVGLAQFLPGICLFLITGNVADRVPRQRIVRLCAGGFSLCSGLLLFFTLRHVSTPYPLYAALLLNGTVRAFNAPASQAFLPLLVPREVFQNAVAWNASVFQTATIAGPMLGGLLYGLSGSPLPVYTLAAGCYLTSSVLYGFLKLTPAAKSLAARTSGMLLEGLRYIWRTKIVLGASSLDLFAVLLGGAVALLPVYAREILHVGATGLGVLRAAPGLGAVLTSLALARWPLERRAGLAMLFCVFGFGVFTVAFGLSQNLALSLVMLFLIGASDTISVIVRSTMLQLSTPDEMRGRVSAVNMVFIGASNEVGQFESGMTAQWFGAVPAVVLGGVGTILVVLVWAGMFPSLRNLDRLNAIKVSEPVPVD
jgi:MFS family permease